MLWFDDGGEVAGCVWAVICLRGVRWHLLVCVQIPGHKDKSWAESSMCMSSMRGWYLHSVLIRRLQR